jgi:thiol-disulfide isomerase/thioredoxin
MRISVSPFMRHRVAFAVLTAAVAFGTVTTFAVDGARPAPPFPTHDAKHWIGTPATWQGLRGRVVLLDVWTFGCINCVRSLPWVKDVRARYADQGLAVVGVHTPEFDRERERRNVEAAVAKHGLDYPHLLDADYAYWKALGNEYWPTAYLVDRCGRIRVRHVGEVHSGQQSGRALEREIERLLAEPADCPP